MRINTHDRGDLVRVTGSFTDPDTGDAIDPEVVNVTITNPNGSETQYVFGVNDGVANPEVGEYSFDIDVQIAGRWYYRWWSSGTGQAAQKKWFNVVDAATC